MLGGAHASLAAVSDLARRYSNSVPILLVPPSEGKAEGGGRHPWSPDDGAFGRSPIAERRADVVAALAALGGGTERLLGVRGDHLMRALSANTSLVGAPSLPAWKRYTGVVWDHLDPASLTAAQRRQLVVVSGLLGVVRADDPTPDYRLKMGANLPPLGKLSTWWRADVSATINRFAGARTKRPRMIVDLLPQEHRAAWRPDERVAGVSIRFVDASGGSGAHFAKAAKGRLARSILEHGPSAIDDWTDDQFTLEVTAIEADD